jgi:hypothetical protein
VAQIEESVGGGSGQHEGLPIRRRRVERSLAKALSTSHNWYRDICVDVPEKDVIQQTAL